MTHEVPGRKGLIHGWVSHLDPVEVDLDVLGLAHRLVGTDSSIF